ncbi:serine hydrolase [Marinicella meishanensis]|uniref:serine hydrolase n=1 Tax=Marinicella meishanensis TaxID=2873263 RepID=UPI001CBD6762|nr:serine hydrolase [Marinicella sp. NBU2979]
MRKQNTTKQHPKHIIKGFVQGFLLLSSLMLMLVLPAYAISDPESKHDPSFEALIAALEAKRQEHHIAGMAIAVVKGDQVVLRHGFGLMDLEQQTPVTPETLFAIGSTSKAFTATLAAIQVDQGQLQWDDPASQYLPNYRFTVDDAELPITIQDMLSHRTGYTRNDLLWANGQASRELILKTATKAKPWDDFRKNFHYNNVMYLATGEITAQLAGMSWDEQLQQALLKPLGMDDTTSIHEQAIAHPQIALGYQWNDATETHDLMPRRNLNNVAPAGGIYSNVNDMAHWVRMLLNTGQFNGQQLVSAEQLQATWQPSVKIADTMDYGMGWFLQQWQGQQVVEHGGSIDGYGAQVTLLPEVQLGYVLLTNNTASPLQQESIHVVLSHLLPPEVQATSAAAQTNLDYSSMVGEYHANFASFKDSLFTFLINDNGRPAVDVPGQMVYELKDPDEHGKMYFIMTDTVAVSFDRDQAGAITAMRMHQNRMDFELPKKGVPIAPEVDPSELAAYLGQYQSKTFNGPIQAIIQNHRLTLDVPNQMAFELHLPDAEGFRQFRIKADMSAQFETDESGQISQLVLYRDREKVVDTAPRITADTAAKAEAELPDVAALMVLMNNEKQLKALRKKSGFRLSGTIEMVNSGITGQVTMAFDAKHSYAQHMDFGTFGEISLAVNEHGAATTGINPYTELKGKYLKQIRMDHPAVALDLANQAEQIQVRGRRELHGRSVYVMRVKITDLPTRTYYIDAQNGDVLRMKTQLMNPVAGNIPVTIDYSDHKKKHGLRLPMTTTIKNPMMGLAIIRYDDFKGKQKFADDAFVIEP